MEKWIESYKKDGFFVARNLIPADVPIKVLSEIDALCESQLRKLQSTHIPFKDETTFYQNIVTLFNADLPSYLAVARHMAKLLSVQDLMCHESVRNVVRALGIALPSIPTSTVVNIMSEKLKIPGGYFGVNPHQDWPSIQGSLDAVVVWTPLTKVPATNFPLQMIPGSHKRGLIDGVDTAYARELAPHTYKDDDFVSVEVNPGDAIFFTTFTAHRTGLMHQGKPCSGLRIGCNFRYENSLEPHFVERNFYCAYKRTVERALATPDFPSAAQVNKTLKVDK